jgi:hypothetical protein
MLNSSKDIVIITDIGSVDPDDVFSLLILTTFDNINIKGIITSHFYSKSRAWLCNLILNELGKKEIPIYADSDIDIKNEFDQNDYDYFKKYNELFPSLFGYPKSVCRNGDRQWFPNFMKAYIDEYKDENYSANDISGEQFLTNLLENYSFKIPTNLYYNMNIFAMGGGFEKFPIINSELCVEKAGYNWAICPNITQQVLDKLTETNQKIKLVSSELVRRKNITISPILYQKWLNLTNDAEKITKVIMHDWLLCNRGNKLSEHKNLCDPLTLYLAINQDMDVEDYHTFINYDESINSYLETKNLIRMVKNEKPNVSLIINFPECVHQNILNRLEHVLFPYNRIKIINTLVSDDINDKKIFKVNANTDIDQLKHNILTNMNFKGNIVQIVGDCVPYSISNTLYCMNFLKNNLDNFDIIEYGMTGSKKEFDLSYDINHMTSQIIDEYNMQSIANAVDYHTIVALRDWNCTYSRLNKCIVLYVNDGKALFGDDVIISDGLCDKLICIEGGIQSFLQIVNCLNQNKSVLGLFGVRRITEYFSACEFLSLLNDKMNEFEVINILNEYLKDKKLYDKNKGDAGTKQNLFNLAWNSFIQNKSWTKLHLMTINHYSLCSAL